MSSQDNHPVKAPSGGLIGELALRIKLIMRLMADKRVFPLLKLLPVGTLLYLVIPDIVIGPLDDAAVVGLGMSLFVELCPEHVVAEHMRALRPPTPPPGTPPAPDPSAFHEEDILEGDFRDADASQPSANNGNERAKNEH
ncbi:MAG: YkvA family protein [Bellilinea sp.]